MSDERRIVRCLSLVFSSSGVITSLAAIRTLFPKGGASIIIGVCDWPGAGDDVNAERLRVIRDMTREFDDVEAVLPLRDHDFNLAQQARSMAEAIRTVRAALGGVSPDQILFSHDCCGIAYQALCAAWPEAERVCYGDCFGSYGGKEKYIQLNNFFGVVAGRPIKSALWLIGYALRRRLNRQWLRVISASSLARFAPPPDLAHTRFRPHRLCAPMPMFPASHSRFSPPLVAVPRSTFTDVIRRVGVSIGAKAYSESLLAHCGDRPKVLLATENHSEAQGMSVEDEIAMYLENLEPFLDDHPVVIVKPHPGETWSRSEPLRERLAGRAEVVDFDPALARLPLELFEEMVCNITVVTAGCLIYTLSYLYGITVVNGLNKSLIERYVAPSQQEIYLMAESAWTSVHERCANWDEKGVIFESQPTWCDWFEL